MPPLDTVGGPSHSWGRVGVYPFDPPRVSASGPAPYRMLIVGGESLAGRGVTTHQLALTGCLARALGLRLRHGVDIEALVLPGTGILQHERALRTRALAPLDAVLLLLERDERSTKAVAALRPTLLTLVERMADPALLVVVIAPSRTASQRADTFESAVRAAAQDLAEVVAIDRDPVPARTTVERYVAWAESVADPMASLLGAPQLSAASAGDVDEPGRVRAVREAEAAATVVDQALLRIVNFASASYRTRTAAISLIDRTTTRYISSRHLEARAQNRYLSVCNAAMQTYGGLIVPDLRTEDRFAHLPAVRTGDAVFYAGHRLVSPEGLPIGALCVFDPHPRDTVTEADLVTLRDFALAAERRLWRVWSDHAPAQPQVVPTGSSDAVSGPGSSADHVED